MASEEIIVSAIKKLEAKPGDCIVMELTNNPPLSQHAIHQLDAAMKICFPGVKVLLCGGVTFVAVLSNPRETGKAAPAEGEGSKA